MEPLEAPEAIIRGGRIGDLSPNSFPCITVPMASKALTRTTAKRASQRLPKAITKKATKAPAKHPGGRPAWKPTPKMIERPDRPGIYTMQTEEQAMDDARALVRHYVGVMGYEIPLVGRLLNPPIHDDKTVRKYFQHEIDYGLAITKARIGAVAIQMATSGRHPDMTRFLCRTKLQWSDRPEGQGEGNIMIETMPGDDAL